jgi:Family of unknown function (DUF5681)
VGEFPSKEHQWPPGKSGNPGGRPRRKPITDRIRELLEQPALPGPDGQRLIVPPGMTLADVIAIAYVIDAALGDVKARKELVDRVEGKSLPGTNETDEVDARDALRAQALEMTRARHGKPSE